MAFWLAKARKGQETSHIQRFDPRFWTVNFPRPAMASVVATSPDSLEVKCEFHNQSDLVGLIWDSVDSLDHPLLSYQTDRDYSRTTLAFDWVSSGLIALDQPNGPTLTIEGRDANGVARSWFVRLWNYASGSATDAHITLPFSALGAGWSLPGEPVYPKDIDRMFISLVPPGYDPQGSAPLPDRVNGQVAISNIRCDGARAMLEIGDVLLPPHGERVATAYDDGYNQTPERILRSVIALGYRDEIVHYVGMSHFPRLAREPGGALLVDPGGLLCEPAIAWHRALIQGCKANDLEIVLSISFELFDSYCPDEWKQRSYDGEAPLTGWVPPSTLLSPANGEAMSWLTQSAIGFASLAQAEGAAVKLQIGEPWWWIMADGRPCFYDNATLSALGGQAPHIIDLKQPLDQAELDLLDAAGAILAQATGDLITAVANAIAAPVETHLLVFTPTILDPAYPEIYRANLPAQWAYPAFDRLQLEDYDWVIGGHEALRAGAYGFVDQKLGYPLDRQDYFAGFVLDAQDAENLWPLIDAALDEARRRGVAHRYVWALPQITRDGYTRMPPATEDIVQAFDDVLYPFALGRAASVAPEFSTSVVVTSSGHERRNALWSNARMHFDVGPGIRSEDELGQLIAFFRARRGPARGFLLTDPFDFSSNGMTLAPTANDQLLGTGDGVKASFQLVKRYGEQDDPQIRPITRPRAASVRVSLDGVETQDFTLGEKGLVVFSNPPANGVEVRAGFLFDVPVRFAEDRIDISGLNFAAGEAPSVPLVEIREVE